MQIIIDFIMRWSSVFISVGLLIAGVVAGLVLQFIVIRLLRIIAKKTATRTDDIIVDRLKGPFKLIGPLFIAGFIFPFTTFSQPVLEVIKKLVSVMFTLSVAWILISLASAMEKIISEQFDIRQRDNLQARKIQTQFKFLKRLVIVVVVIVTSGVILMYFEQIRQLGTALLASAGVVGVILGFAAQQSIATLFAGFQIAFTQPIRIDDVVIVENEWGWIEEINLTYVVVRIWDLRRLILPITYFTQKPFQNWTRISADILGTVFIESDYTLPVAPVREKLQEIVDNHPLWDRKVCNLQVTDTGGQTMTMRALLSAANSSALWDLRCDVREKLIDYLQSAYPQCLPRVRADLFDNSGINAQHKPGTRG